MSNLKDFDPDFYNYLAKYDTNLLHFADEEVNNTLPSLLGKEEVAQEAVEKSEESDVESSKIQNLGRIAKKAASGSILSLRKLFSVFRSMVNSTFSLNREDNDDVFALDDNLAYKNYLLSQERLSIILSAAFVGLCTATDVNPARQSTTILQKISDNRQSKHLKNTIENFLKAVIKLLNCLSVTKEDQREFIQKLLPQLLNHQIFLVAFPSLLRLYVKAHIRLWTESIISHADACSEILIESLRKLAHHITMNHLTGVEEVFKLLYNSFLNLARDIYNSTILSKSLHYVVHCYSCDVATAYQQSFLYIRQLSLHLRIAMIKNVEASTKAVKSWEFLWSLKLWARMISQFSKSEIGFNMFCYPIVQIVLGVYKLVSSVYFLPFRLHLIHELQTLASCLDIFIPTNKLLQEAADSFSKICELPNKSAASLPFDLHNVVSFPNNSLESPAIRLAVLEDLVAKVRFELNIYKGSNTSQYFFLLVKKLKTCCQRLHDSRYQKVLKALVNHVIGESKSSCENGVVKLEDAQRNELMQEEKMMLNSSPRVDSLGKKKFEVSGEEASNQKLRKKRRLNETVSDKVTQLLF